MKNYFVKIAQKNKIATEFIVKLSTFSIGPIIAAIIGVIFVPIITRFVEPHLYGQLAMFITGTSLVSMIMFLGTDQAFVRDYSISKDTGKLWFNSFSLPFMFSLFLAVIAVIYRETISLLLFDTYHFIPSLLFALMLPILVIERYVLLSVRMYEVGRFYSILTITTKMVTVVITIFLVFFFGPGLIQLILPITLASLVIIIISMLSVYRPIVTSWALDKQILKRQLKFGLPLVLSTAQFWVLNSLDKLALRTWSSYTEIGIYAAGFSLVIPLLIIKNSFTTFWAPMRYRWIEEGVSYKRFQKVTDSATLFMILIFAIMLPLRWLIIYLLGPDYREAVKLVPLVLVFPMMYTLSETTSMGISFSRKTYWDIVSTGFAAVVNIIGNWMLVPDFGALGAAISTAASFIIFFWIRTIISNKLWQGLNTNIHLLATFIILLLNALAIAYSDWRVDLAACVFVCGIVVIILILKFKKNRYNIFQKNEINV